MLKLIRDLGAVDMMKVEVLEKETGIIFKDEYRHQDNFNTVDIEIDGKGIAKPVDFKIARDIYKKFDEDTVENSAYKIWRNKTVAREIKQFCLNRNRKRKGNLLSLRRDITNFLLDNYCKMLNNPYEYGDTPVSLYSKKRGNRTRLWAGHEYYAQVDFGFVPNKFFFRGKSKKNRMMNIKYDRTRRSNSTVSNRNSKFWKSIEEISDDYNYRIGYKYNPKQGFKHHIYCRYDVLCNPKSPMALKHDKHNRNVCIWAW